MIKHRKAIHALATFLCVATTASTALPFVRGRDLEEAAHVLTFCGMNLWEVSPIWGTAVVLGPLLLLAYLLCEAPTALWFPLAVYQATAVPAALMDLRNWATEHGVKLLTGLQVGWAVYVCLSVTMLVCTLTAICTRTDR